MSDEERTRTKLAEEARKAFEEMGHETSPQARRTDYPQTTPEQESDMRREVAVGPDLGGGELTMGEGSPRRMQQQSGIKGKAGEVMEKVKTSLKSKSNGDSKSRIMQASATGKNVTVNGVTMTATAETADVKGFSGAVVTQGNVDMKGFSGAVVNRGDTHLTGGTAAVVTGNDTQINKGGAALVVSRKVRLSDNGYAGIVLSRKVKCENGGTVIISTVPALLIGAAFGVVFGGISWMIANGGMGGAKKRAHQLSGEGKRVYKQAQKRGRKALVKAEKQGMKAMRDARKMMPV